MDTKPISIIRPAAARSRETFVEDLFGPGGGGPLATNTGAALAASPGIVIGGGTHPDTVVVDDDQLGAGPVSPGRPLGAGRAAARSWRLQPVPDISGPRVRLGLLWLVAAGVALLAGAVPAALVLAGVAGVGAVQVGAALRKAGGRNQPILAGGCAVAVVLAGSAPTSRAVGLALLMAVVASLISALHLGGFDLVSAGCTVRSWLGIGLAGAAPVILARGEASLALLLLVLVCTYDAGDFLVGSAAANALEGPLAGMVGLLAVGCVAMVVQPAALSQYRLWPAVVLSALACPIGQLLASATLPHSNAFAPGLRRLDSLLVTGPLWLLLFA